MVVRFFIVFYQFTMYKLGFEMFFYNFFAQEKVVFTKKDAEKEKKRI